MNDLVYGYACFACGVAAHIFYLRLRAEIRNRRTSRKAKENGS